MKNILFISILTLLSSSFALAQITSIEGYVINSQTKEPLVYANISIDEGGLGTSTDENGYFKLDVRDASKSIIVSYIGFKSDIIDISEYLRTKQEVIELYPKGLMLQEVEIFSSVSSKSEHIEVSSLSLQNDQIVKISNAMPDVLRAFQALPGISTNNEFSAEFNVRGGNKDENLIQVNGAQVYEPFHLKEVPNASVGVFNSDLIGKVNLITGGFSARYGDRLSSVANIDYREGDSENYKGAATLSLAFVDGFLEGPFLDKGSFIVGVRKTYMEYVIDMTDFGYENIRKADPSFYDLQGMISYPFGKSDKLKFAFLRSADNFTYDPNSLSSTTEYSATINNSSANVSTQTSSFQKQRGDYYSSLLDLEHIKVINEKAFIKTNLSYYDQYDKEYSLWGTFFKKDIYGDNHYFDQKRREDLKEASLTIKTLELKSSLDYQMTPFYEMRTGFSYKDINYYDRFNYEKYAINSSTTITYPDTLIENYGYTGLGYRNDSLNASSFKYAGYFENVLQIGQDFLLNAAGRFDYFGMNKELNFSPRLNLAYSTNYGTILRFAWGHYYQSPIYTQLKYSEASDSNTKSQKAIHYVMGVEQNVNLSANSLSTLKIKVDGYYKDYKSLISSFFAHGERLAYSRENDAVGYSTGIDFYILLNVPGFNSWISYSYLIAREDKLDDDYGEYPRLTGQDHTLAWISDIDFGNNWSFNTKFYYGSGYPYAEKFITYTPETDEYYWQKSETNDKYLPAYQRLDLRLTKNFKFDLYTIKTFIEVSNSLNHKNIRGYDYTYDDKGNPVAYEIMLWPILPSFGIRVEF
ncbi:MAG: TonB-dependent receptor [Ignavibacteriales bacterium]|nr:TonB-dependent receptor [Ignavibacteriales bacterium]